MRKKIKLWALIGSFLVLASCDSSCSFFWHLLYDSRRFVYIVTSNGVYGLNSTGSFLIQATAGMRGDSIVTPRRLFLGSLWPDGYPTGFQPVNTTSQKPPMFISIPALNAVLVIDSNSDQVITRITVGNNPMGEA